MYIGAQSATSSNFKGQIDNVRLFDQKLSPSQLYPTYDGSAGSKLFSYDANGNTIQKGDLTFTYNDANRMASSTIGGTTTTYQYNAKGERSVKRRNGVETHYIYNVNGQLIAEADGQGNVTKAYVYFDGQPLAQMVGDEIYYYHNSHLGTPEMLTDANQNIVWQASYTPFGQATITNETIVNHIRSPGQYYDQESGLHYNYFRDYDPEIGRYIQSDPIGLRGGINTYGYVLQNPINGIDPDGRLAWFGIPVYYWIAGGASGAALWAVSSSTNNSQLNGSALSNDVQMQIPGEHPFADFWGTNPNGDDEEDEGCSSTSGHEHHSDPMFLGGRRNQPTTRMSEQQHGQLHRDLNKFLRERINQRGDHMRPQRNNSGEQIRENFTRRERLEALRDFYRGPGSRYTQAARDFFRQHPGL